MLLQTVKPPAQRERYNFHSIAELNIYGAQRRYEEGPTPATEDDGSEAATMASDALH